MATVAPSTVPPMPEPSFRDGFGVRFVVTDAVTGDRLERLCVSTEVGRQAQTIQERVSRLLNFRHARFPRVRGVEIEKQPDGRSVTWVVAEPVTGIRLIDLLRLAEQSHLTVDVHTVLQFAREILPALATLHDSRDVTHGAIGPERLVLTPQGRVTVVDHVFGAALSKLQYPRVRLWRDFRISMPPAAGVSRFDARADVAGVAMTVLALLVGRPLTLNEYPDHLKDLLDRASERLGTGPERPLTASLRSWLERALPLDSRKPLLTALEAQVALDAAIKKERAYAPGAAAVKHFIDRVGPVLAAVNWGAPVIEAPAAAATTPEAEQADAVVATPRKPLHRGPARPAPRRHTPEEEEAEEIAFLERELARLAAEEAANTSAVATSPVAEAPVTAPIADTVMAGALTTEAGAAPAAVEPVSGLEAGAPPHDELDDAPAAFTLVGNDGAPLAAATPFEDAAAEPSTLPAPVPKPVAPVAAVAMAGVPAPAAEVVDLSALLDAAVETASAAESPTPVAEGHRARTRTTLSRATAHPESRRKSHAPIVPAAIDAPATAAAPADAVASEPEVSPDLGAVVEIIAELPRRLASSPRVQYFEFSEEGTVDLTGELDGPSEGTEQRDEAAAMEPAEVVAPVEDQAAVDVEQMAGPLPQLTGVEPQAETQPAGEPEALPTLRRARALAGAPLARALRPVAPIVSEETAAEAADRRGTRETRPRRRRARAAAHTALPERTSHAAEAIVRPRDGSVLDAVVGAGMPALHVFPPIVVPPHAAPASLAARSVVSVEGALACAPAAPMLRSVVRTRGRLLAFLPGVRRQPLATPLLMAERSVVPVTGGVGVAWPASLSFQPAFALFREPMAAPAAAGRVDDVPAGVVMFDHATAITGEIAEVCYSAAAYQPAAVAFREPVAPPAAAGRVDRAPAGVRVFDRTTAIEGEVALHCYSADAYQPASVDYREPPAAPPQAGCVDDVPAGVVVFDHATAITGEIAEACYSAAAYQPATVAFREPLSPPAAAGRVDGVPAGVVLFDISTAIDESAPDATADRAAAALPVSADYQEPPAAPPQAGRVDDVPAGVRVFDHSTAIEGEAAEVCYSAAAYQPGSVDFKAPGAPPAAAGRVDGVPAGVVLFDHTTAIEEPAPTASTSGATAIALPASSADTGAAGDEHVGSRDARPGLSPEEELRRLIASLEFVDEAPARAADEVVEIDLTSAIVPAAEAVAPATLAVPAVVAPIVVTAAAATTVVAAPTPASARSNEPGSAPLASPAPGPAANAPDAMSAPAGGGRRRRSRGRGRKDHRPVEAQSVAARVDAVPVVPAAPAPPAPAVPVAPPRVVPPRLVTVTPTPVAPLSEPAAKAVEPAAAAKIDVPAVAEPPHGPRPGDVVSSPSGRVHHASPAIEATLPQYAPWLTADPMPLGAAEASSRGKTVATTPDVSAGAPEARLAQPAPAAPEPPPIRLAPAPERAARGAQPSEPAAIATHLAPPAEPSAGIRLAAPPDVSVSTGIRLAPPPEPARASQSSVAAFGASVAASAPAVSRVAQDDRSADVAPGVAVAAAARELRLSSTGHWPKALVASVAAILIAGAAFGAYWYASPSATGTLSVQASVAGVEVLVDGRERGNTPLRVDLAPGRHVIEMRGFGTTRTLPVEITAGVLTTQNVKWPAGRQSGTLKVTTMPAGASVKLDGEVRGVTPVELEGVFEGAHNLQLEAPTGTVKKAVKVVAGETTEIEEPIFSGWLTVFAPFRVKVLEDGVSLGSSEDGKLMLGCGTHKLEFVNATFNVRETRTVEISPGGTTTLSLEAPRGEIEVVNVADGTEVWIDNEPKGTTPMPRISLPVGTHNVLLRPGQGRSFTVEVVGGKVIQVPKGASR